MAHLLNIYIYKNSYHRYSPENKYDNSKNMKQMFYEASSFDRPLKDCNVGPMNISKWHLTPLPFPNTFTVWLTG